MLKKIKNKILEKYKFKHEKFKFYSWNYCEYKAEIENLERKYEDFIQTKKGKKWLEKCKKYNMDGNFGDYLYDFYPEYLF